MRLVSILVALAGCGPGKNTFVPEYADGYCSYLLACEDPAVLTFDGILSVEDCLAVVGPVVEERMATCKYHSGKAGDCLKGLEVAACPAEGATIDESLPPVCSEVWTDCPPVQDNEAATGDTDV